MKRAKQVGAMLLAIAMILALLPNVPIQAKAATATDSGTCGENVTWTLDDEGTLTISGTGPMNGYESEYDTPWYSNKSNIKAIVVETGVTAIGECAFYGCDQATEISIASTVTTIGNRAFSGCNSLTEVTLPEGVTRIGLGCFAACKKLSNVTLPNSLVGAGSHTFAESSNLTEVTLGRGLTSIPEAMFNNTSLVAIKIPEGATKIYSNAFFGCHNLATVTIPKSITYIDEYAFYMTGIDDVYYGGSIADWAKVSIGEMNDALKNATLHTVEPTVTGIAIKTQPNKTEYTVGENLDTTGLSLTVTYSDNSTATVTEGFTTSGFSSASAGEQTIEVGFEGKTVTFVITVINRTNGTCGENVTWTLDDEGTLTISGTGPMTDYECDGAPWNSNRSSVKKVVIEGGVTTIGDSAIYYCDNLTSVTIPDSITAIGWSAFSGCTSLTSVTIPDSVATIGDGAFAACRSLSSVTIGNSVTTIGASVFSWCTNLTSVTIPDSVTTIGAGAFYNCTSLTSVTIPDSVTTIGYGAFAYCTSLTSVTIPYSVTAIDDEAFDSCNNLTDVYFEGAQEQWDKILIGSSNECLTGANVHIAYTDTAKCGDDVYWTFIEDGTLLIFGTGAMSDGIKGWHYSEELYPSIKKVVINEGVTHIGEQAFLSCYNLQEITIPDSVTSIGSVAFGLTNLKEITIPASVTNIGDGAFVGAHVSLADDSSIDVDYISHDRFIVDAGNPNYSSDSSGNLYNKDQTTLLAPVGLENGSYTVNNGVTTIGMGAFGYCNALMLITIPESVTAIEESAFYGCESLTAVRYGGTREQWEAITIDVDNDCLENATVICSGETSERRMCKNGHTSEAACEAAECSAELVVWTAWTETDSLPTEGFYYLENDVTVTSATYIENSLVLDLNGYTITRQTSNSADVTAYGVSADGALHLWSSIPGLGKITVSFYGIDPTVSGSAGLVTGSGTMIIEGITIDGSAVSDSIYLSANSGAVTNGGKLYINNATINGYKHTNGHGTAIGTWGGSYTEINGAATLIVGGNATNATSGQGEGGVIAANGEWVINDGTFKVYSGTAASKHGGLIILTGTSEMTVNGGTFYGNTVTANGACINTSNRPLTINGGTFYAAKANQGGVIRSSGDLLITGGTFYGTGSDTTKQSSSGGLIYSNSTTAVITGGTFINGNDANGGPNIYFAGGTLTIAGDAVVGGEVLIYGTTTQKSNLIVGGNAIIDYKQGGFSKSRNIRLKYANAYLNDMTGSPVASAAETVANYSMKTNCKGELVGVVSGNRTTTGAHTYVNDVCTLCGDTAVIISSGTCGTNVTWTLTDTGTLTISGTGKMDTGSGYSSPWRYSSTPVENVVIKDGVTTISYGAFNYCDKITTITISHTVTTIEHDAFFDCDSLSHVYYTGPAAMWNAIDIGNYNSELTSAVLHCAPAVASGTCGSRMSWTLTDFGMLFISGTGPIADYSAADNAPWHEYAQSITSIRIDSGVTKIGNWAFGQLSNLTDATIPDTITTVGDNAFSGCTSLSNVYYNSIERLWNETAIGENNSNLTGATFHYDTTITGSCGANLSYIRTSTGILIITGVGAMYDYEPIDSADRPGPFSGLSFRKVIIDEGVTSLGDWAFYACYIDELILPQSITTAGRDTFNTYRLDKVTYPGTWEQWGTKELYIPNKATLICSDGSYKLCGPSASWKEDNDVLIITGKGAIDITDDDYISESPLPWVDHAIIIREGITEIGSNAFLWYSLGVGPDWVYIPASVTKIASDAFSGEYDISDVYFGGTQEQWNAIGVNLGATMHYETEVRDIAIATQPKKTAYLVGEELDTTGLTLSLSFTDGTAQTLPGGFTVKNFNSATAGTKTVYAWYDDFFASFKVTVANSIGGSCGTNATWSLDTNGTMTISGTGAMASYTAASEAPWHDRRDMIKKVVIEDGITTVGQNAFSGCVNLTHVDLGNVTTINSSAFSNCAQLKEIEFPETLTKLGNGAFQSSGLTTVTIPDTITTLGSSAFRYCKALTKAEIGSGAQDIFSNTFDGCTALEDVTIGSNVVNVGSYAFRGCTKLTAITLPDSVTNVYGNAFSGCTALEELHVSAKTSSFGANAFADCSALTKVYLKDMSAWMKVSFADTNANPLQANSLDKKLYLNGELVTDLVIPTDVTTIPAYIFHRCSNIKTVTLSDNVTTVGASAFFDCTGLEAVYISSSVTNVSNSAFIGCIKLRAFEVAAANETYSADASGVLYDKDMSNVLLAPVALSGSYTVAETIESIAVSAFNGCSKLESISLPIGLVAVGKSAFNGCTGLKNVYYGGPQEMWEQLVIGGENAPLTAATVHFADVYVTGMSIATLPEKVQYRVGQKLDLSGMTLTVSYSNGSTATTDSGYRVSGYDRNIAGEQTLTVFYHGQLVDFTVTVIQPTITSITVSKLPNKTAYQYGEALDTTGLELTVTYSDDYVETVSEGFTVSGYDNKAAGKQTISVTYGGKSVTYDISVTASGSCSENLTWALDDEGTLTISGIGPMENWSSYYDQPWHSLGASIKKVVIEEGVTTIGDYAFYCSTLESVTIPNSVTTIGMFAFAECFSLTAVTIPSGVTSIGKSAFQTCLSLVDVTILDGLVSIGENAFTTSTLKTISIPKSVTTIGNAAFIDCVDLTDVYYNGTQKQWNSITIGRDNEYLTDAALHCNLYVASGTCGENLSWKLDDDGTLIISGTGAMDNYAHTEAPWYAYNQQIDKIVIENGVTTVGDYAFYQFLGGVTEIEFPDSIETIGKYAMSCMMGLEKVTLPKNLTEISEGLFAGSASDSTKFEIMVPAGVTTIGDSAFVATPPDLVIHFEGTQKQWDAITIGENNGVLSSATINVKPTVEITVNGSTQGFDSIGEAIEELVSGSEITIWDELKENISISKDIELDLNGFTITGNITVQGSAKVELKDTSTDDYSVGDGEYGKIVGNAEGIEAAKGYIKITENGMTSFHRLNLDTVSVNTRPAKTGMYFSSQFGGDEVVKRNIVAYGTAMGAGKMPDFAHKTFTRFDATSWKPGCDSMGNSNNLENGTLLQGILHKDHGYTSNKRYADMKIYSQAYVELADGTRILGDVVSFSFRDTFEGTDTIVGIDQRWSSLTDAQKQPVLQMYSDFYRIMSGWNIPNIKSRAK